MPTVKTIKPLGGGDFTTLAAWQVFAAAQATADQWAECYSGGDLGRVTLSGWVSAPSASVHPRVYAEPGSRHNGKIVGAGGTNGAYVSTATSTCLSISVPFMEVDGLILNAESGSTNAVNVTSTGREYFFHNNIVRRNTGTASRLFSDATSPVSKNQLHNNVWYYAPAVTASLAVAAVFVNDGDPDTGGPTYVVNNTLLANQKCGVGFTLNFVNLSSVVWNNFVYGTNTGGGGVSLFDSNDAGAGEHVAGYSNNATDDGKSGFYGDMAEQSASGAVTLYVVSGTDPTPISGSVLVNRGISSLVLGLPASDVIGTVRPQGSAYDIGAFEFIPAAAGGGRRRRHTTEVYL